MISPPQWVASVGAVGETENQGVLCLGPEVLCIDSSISIPSTTQPQHWVFAGTQEVAFLWVRREVIESSRLFSIWMKYILYLWIIGMIKTFTVQHFSAMFGGRRHSKRTQYALSGPPVFWFFYNHKTCFIIKWWLPPWRSDGFFTLFWKKKIFIKENCRSVFAQHTWSAGSIPDTTENQV